MDEDDGENGRGREDEGSDLGVNKTGVSQRRTPCSERYRGESTSVSCIAHFAFYKNTA